MQHKHDAQSALISPHGAALILCRQGETASIQTHHWGWLLPEEGADPPRHHAALIRELSTTQREVVVLPFDFWLLLHKKGANDVAEALRKNHHRVVVALFPEDDVLKLTDDIRTLIAEDFAAISCYVPAQKEGRHFSTAALLRGQWGYQGLLVAHGDILLDQVNYLSRVGFDGVMPRADQDAQKSLAALQTFSVRAQDDWRGVRSQKAPVAATPFLQKPALWQIPEVAWTEEREAQRRTLHERLQTIFAEHKTVAFATSLAAEDMVLTHALSKGLTKEAAVEKGYPVQWKTLQIGRLHQETLAMIDTVEAHFGMTIDRLVPDEDDVQAFVDQYGLNGFYDSEAAKKACCRARKVLPLAQGLIGMSAWITGQRREQSTTRAELNFLEVEKINADAHAHPSSATRHKYNPIFDWQESDVWAYLQHFNVPIHPLHRAGYPSIGCEPCTRAVKMGENVRAGRWWWLTSESKECGLHQGTVS